MTELLRVPGPQELPSTTGKLVRCSYRSLRPGLSAAKIRYKTLRLYRNIANQGSSYIIFPCFSLKISGRRFIAASSSPPPPSFFSIPSLRQSATQIAAESRVPPSPTNDIIVPSSPSFPPPSPTAVLYGFVGEETICTSTIKSGPRTFHASCS